MSSLEHVTQMEMALLGAIMEEPEENGPLVFGTLDVDQMGSRVYHLAVAVHERLAESQPITPQLVMDTMRLQGRLKAETGPLIADCLSLAYATPSVKHYVDALAEVYAARRLYQIGMRVQQMAGTSDVSTTLAYLQGEAASIAADGARRIHAPSQTLADILAEPDQGPVDWLIPNILPTSDRLLITAEEGAGKALALDTPVLTANRGWTTMGELHVGDAVFGPDGKPTVVLAATEPMADRPCYRVAFSDGASIVADADHQWRTLVLAPNGRRVPGGITTTRRMGATLKARKAQAANHAIPTCDPLHYPPADLPIPPYLLGAWLGDGTSQAGHLTIDDDDDAIIERIRSEGPWPVAKRDRMRWAVTDGTRRGRAQAPGDTFQGSLRLTGLLGDKHIPTGYLQASADQRLALLQGLMDTDGTVDRTGQCEFSATNERLANDTLALLLGLGVKARLAKGDALLHGITVGTRYRISFTTDLPVFHLPRKAARMRQRPTRRGSLRYVTSVEQVASVPVRCIQVADPSGMFLAGQELVATHNSTMLRQAGLSLALGIGMFEPQAQIEPQRALLIDAEVSRRQLVTALRRMYEFASRWDHQGRPENLFVESRQGGIDLCEPGDQAWLLRLVREHRPRLVALGPLYRMVGGDINDEVQVRCWQRLIEPLLEEGVSVVMEHHSPNAQDRTGRRDLRPIGSSVIRRWFSQGVGVRGRNCSRHDNPFCTMCPRRGRIEMWRGSRDETHWPYSIRSPGSDIWWMHDLESDTHGS